ncbi:MAG: surface-adhesin E family protein [Thermodesulfobacteriota bacterium]
MTKRSGVVYIALFSALILLFSCRGGESDNDSWKFVATIKDEKGADVDVYLDTANIEINGDTRKFWIKYVATKEVDGAREEYVRQTGYWEINCFDRSLYRLAEEYFSPSGKLLGRTEKRVWEEYSSYQSLGAKMSDMACRYAGQ